MRTIEHSAAFARMEDARRAAAQERLARQAAHRPRPRRALGTLLAGGFRAACACASTAWALWDQQLVRGTEPGEPTPPATLRAAVHTPETGAHSCR